MSKKILFVPLVLSVLLLSQMAKECFADASAQLEQAETYKQDGNYEQAEQIYQQILTDFPDSNDALEAQKQLILIYIATDSQQQADAALQELVANFYMHKDIAQAVHDIAYQYRLLQKYEKANQIDEYVVDNWPQSDYAVLGQMDLAKYYVDQGDDPNAEAAFDKLLASFSNNPLIARAVHDVAQHYRFSGKFEEANQLYQYVLDNWPEAEHAMWAEADLIKSYLALGDDTAAEAAVDKLFANFSEHPLIARAVWDTGQHYRDLKRYENANQLYQYVIDNWPDSEHALWAQADLIKSYLALGDDPNAEVAVDKLLINFTDNPLIARVIWDTGQVYRDLKKYEKANRLYQHVTDNWPDSEHALWAQADLIKSYLALGDDPNAEAAVDKLLADFSNNPLIARAVWDTARVYRDLKKYEKASQLYQHVIDDYPQAEHAILSQIGAAEVNVLSLIDSGNDMAAQEALDSLIADFNDQPALPQELFSMAVRYFHESNYRQAIRLWKLVLTEYPDCPVNHEIPYLLATCYEYINDWETAIQYYKEALEKYPNSLYTHRVPHRIGLLYRFATEYDNALYWLEQQRELYPDSHLQAQRALFEQGAVYFLDIKDYQKAIEVFQQYITEYPDDEHTWPAYRCLAKCYENTGNTSQAIMVLQEALNRFSESKYVDAIKAKLDKIQEGGEQ